MRTPSPSRNTATFDAREKLKQYNIEVEAPRELPVDLQRFVAETILKPRDAAGPRSPNSKKIVQRRRLAAQQNKATGSQMIAPYLLFAGEADLDERIEAVPFITCKAKMMLNSFFLPAAANKTIKNTWGPLSHPKPDSCIGYVSRSDAAAAGCTAPFSIDEEAIMNDFVLTKFMYMPFLTSQWKTPISSEGMYAAQSQAARDGAAVVNHLYDLYSVAFTDTPSPVDACHFSVVGDLQYGEIWVHYREGPDHHMQIIHNFSYREQAGLEQARGYLHNLKDHAIGARLQSIRRALPAFASAKRTKRSYPPVPMSEAGEPVTVLSQSSSSQFQAPLTLSSVVSEPVKKRQRVQNYDGD